MSGLVRIVGFVGPEEDSGAAAVLAAASASAEVDMIIENGSPWPDFDHGSIDWRARLSGAHWLALSSSTILESDSARSAQGAGMTFAEFEGARVIMVVDMPADEERLAEAWGHVIERIRQIHILFLSTEVLPRIAALEGMAPSDLQHQIRLRGMVPQVCTFDADSKTLRVEHALGSISGRANAESEAEWIARYICKLPESGTGTDGIEVASGLV